MIHRQNNCFVILGSTEYPKSEKILDKLGDDINALCATMKYCGNTASDSKLRNFLDKKVEWNFLP